MEENFSTKEFVENNIKYFQYIEDKTELMTLGYITYQRLQVAGDDGREMIAFTDGNKWYKTPYTKEMYKLMYMNNSTIFEENKVKKYPILSLTEFGALGNVIYENLEIFEVGSEQYIVFSVGESYYRIPYTKSEKKEDDLYEYLKHVNNTREEEKQLNDFIKNGLDSFQEIKNSQELNNLGPIIYENLNIYKKAESTYIIFSDKDSWYKIQYNQKIFEMLTLSNSQRIRELNVKNFLIQNMANLKVISTQEQLNALGNPFYRNLQVITWNGKDWIVFSTSSTYLPLEEQQHFKVPYDRTIKPDALEAYIQANEAKKKAVIMITPNRTSTQNNEAR